MLDLGDWANERHNIPGDPDDPDVPGPDFEE